MAKVARFGLGVSPYATSNPPSTTANYGWAKPGVGDSINVWGNLLNSDLDAIDATVGAIDTSRSTTGTTFESLAVIQATHIPPAAHSISCLSYSVPGDLRGAVMQFVRVGSAPSFPGYVQSADGAYWQLTNTTVTLEMFGGKAESSIGLGLGPGTFDNSPVATAALAYLAGISAYPSGGLSTATTLELGPGVYWFTNSLTINACVNIKGFGGWYDGNVGTMLLCPAGITGIVVTENGVFSTLQDFALQAVKYNAFGAAGGWDGVTIAHGVQSANKVFIYRLDIRNFIGDGLNITGDGLIVHSVYAIGNGRHGIHVYGSDGNAGVFSNCFTSTNGQWGIFDDSFLGNTHIGHLAESSGQWEPTLWVPTNTCTMVQDAGKVWWIARQDGDSPSNLPAAQTTRPSSGGGVWRLATSSASGSQSPVWGEVIWQGTGYTVIPGHEANMWTSQPDLSPTVWQHTGTLVSLYPIVWKLNWSPYTLGGDYASVSPDASNKFYNCYSEGQNLPNCIPPSYMSRTSTMDGGFASGWVEGAHPPGSFVETVSYYRGGSLAYDSPSPIVYSSIGGDHGNGTFQTFSWGDQLNWWEWQFSSDGKDIALNITNHDSPLQVWGPFTAQHPNNCADPTPNCVFAHSLVTGQDSFIRITANSVVPASGPFGEGDFVFNANADTLYNHGFRPFGWLGITASAGGSGATFASLLAVDGTPRTVAQLPNVAYASVNSRAMVTDALSPILGFPVTGGGAVKATVWNRGDAWVVDTCAPLVCAIAALPAATSCQGARGMVTNSSQTASGNFGAALSGTTGTNVAPVYSDGTIWRIG